MKQVQLARVGAKKVEIHIVGSVKFSALELSWAPNWQFPWFGDTCLQKCSCLRVGNAFGCMHMFFLLIWSSVRIQITNFPAENLLRSRSLWAICKITAKRLFLVGLKKLEVSALAQEALQCYLQLLNWRQRVDPMQDDPGVTFLIETQTFLFSYSYQTILNAEKMSVFNFFILIKVRRLKSERVSEIEKEEWKLMQLNCSFQQPQESSAMKMTFPYNWHFLAGAILWFASACVRRPSWRGSFSFSYPSNGI